MFHCAAFLHFDDQKKATRKGGFFIAWHFIAAFLSGLIYLSALPTPGNSAEPPRSSDWVNALPKNETRRKMVLGCTPCHQIGLPLANRSSKQAWETIIESMKKIDDELELSLIPFKPVDLSSWLGEHGSKLPSKGTKVKTEKADFKEFPAGSWKGFYHDMALAGGKAWIADYFGNMLYGVDPNTGEVESHAIPINVQPGKPGGAHAIDTTADGTLWITFTKAEEVARFDTATKEFRIYSGFEKGGNVQYFVLDADRNIYEDPEGGIWFTHFSKEILSRLDPRTGEIKVLKTPRTESLPEKGVHLYAGVADSLGKIWYTETHGNRVGYLDTKTGESEETEMPEPWCGPKRLAIDDEDRLWIPELASGKISVYDTRSRKFIDRISLPIPGDYCYAIRRDPRTGDLWVTGTGSDTLYKLDPNTKKFKIYRLPRRGAYTRTVAFDGTGGIWTCYASFPNNHTEMPHESGVILRMTPK